MASKRITKEDLRGAKVEYFNNNGDLIDSHYDDYTSLGDAINRHIHGHSLSRVTISNNQTSFFAEYKVSDIVRRLYRRVF